MKLLLLLALLLPVQAADDPIQNLQHKDARLRLLGAQVIGAKKMYNGIPALIELLKDEDKPEVRAAAVESLRSLSGRTLGDSYADWNKWWETEGNNQYPSQIITSELVRSLMQPELQELDRRVDKASEKAKADIRLVATFAIIGMVLFVLIMFYFVAHVSSRVKAWKELVGKAEVYIQKGEEITRRTDHIVAELDAKKAEIMVFVGKVREESQGELERFTDMLQKNFEHRMREEMMALRQKAEKELEQTLTEMRAQSDIQLRRSAAEQKEKAEASLQGQRDAFLKEVEAQTLFLDASFHAAHGKHEEALRRYRKLLQLRPDHAMAWSNLGTAYRELERYDEAIESYQKALELLPNSPVALYNLAATFAVLRRKDKMIEALSRAIANDGEYKDEALNDPAFREYWNDRAFKDVAEG